MMRADDSDSKEIRAPSCPLYGVSHARHEEIGHAEEEVWARGVIGQGSPQGHFRQFDDRRQATYKHTSLQLTSL